MRSHVLAAAGALVAANAAHGSPTATEKQLPNRAAALPTVTASGNAFWTGDKRFYVRGIDYQPGGSSDNADPLADPDLCSRDITRFKDLGVNAIRVYSVDNSKDHTECMQKLNDAGIYLVLDVNNPQYSINRDEPEPSYNDKYLQSVFATIDEFAKYDNTLAFFSGNEVINDKPETVKSAPYVKATTRDMRQYIGSRGYRKIPVGYSAADVSENRMQTADYFNCGGDDERSDFFAFNDYSWCAPSSFQQSGWDQKVKNFTGYGLPIFLSEWGCIKNTRDFEELSALMSDQMSGVYSGGLMYEYSREGNGYGIVELSGNSDSVKKESEYDTFKKALAKYPAPSGDGGFTSTTKAVACPTQDSIWDLGKWGESSLPAIPDGAKKFMKDGAGDGPGLTGPGSQNAGGTSTGTATPGSGEVSATASGDNAGTGRPAPPMDMGFLAVTGVVGFFTLAGTLLL
ncbi:Glucanosyltransferase-domain-containing protein [Xylaria bambusicola]|uniref:Glucanosyltransferase-domain-containing protein n=1 Tax=Xylaria bambusicola TaxID=326684 RepID=UPI002007395A|nr:Glucanosyltransferase-domain-containing protein [Xylaria bambusicola]KAI0514516.1 Glucanosyltransferase-domain-containing protein [Xylaria bambusicola]